MDAKELTQMRNRQYMEYKRLEIEIAGIKQAQAEAELSATEAAVNIDYLVCLQDLSL